MKEQKQDRKKIRSSLTMAEWAALPLQTHMEIALHIGVDTPNECWWNLDDTATKEED